MKTWLIAILLMVSLVSAIAITKSTEGWTAPDGFAPPNPFMQGQMGMFLNGMTGGNGYIWGDVNVSVDLVYNQLYCYPDNCRQVYEVCGADETQVITPDAINTIFKKQHSDDTLDVQQNLSIYEYTDVDKTGYNQVPYDCTEEQYNNDTQQNETINTTCYTDEPYDYTDSELQDVPLYDYTGCKNISWSGSGLPIGSYDVVPSVYDASFPEFSPVYVSFPYWVEDNATLYANSNIWIKGNTSTGNYTFYIYGNFSNGTLSSIDNTMIFGDDFDSSNSTINASKWAVYNSATASINTSTGELMVTRGTGDNGVYQVTNFTTSNAFVMMTMFSNTTTTGGENAYHVFGLKRTGGTTWGTDAIGYTPYNYAGSNKRRMVNGNVGDSTTDILKSLPELWTMTYTNFTYGVANNFTGTLNIPTTNTTPYTFALKAGYTDTAQILKFQCANSAFTMRFNWVAVRLYTVTPPTITCSAGVAGSYSVGGGTATTKYTCNLTGGVANYQSALAYRTFNDTKLYITGDPSFLVAFTALNLTPATAYKSSVLNCSFTSNGTDNTTAYNVTLSWYKNGVLQNLNSSFTNLTGLYSGSATLGSGNLTQLDNWSCKVTESAGSTSNMTANVTILNNAPVMGNFALNPTGNVSHSLTENCSFTATDADSDSMNATITWWNGTTQLTAYNYAITNITNGTLVSSNLSSTNLTALLWANLSCRGTLTDSYNTTSANATGSSIITNAAPDIVGLTIAPAPTAPYTDNLSCSYTAQDNSSDLMNGTITWLKNNASGLCYQETATMATACGGVGTGSYSTSGSFDPLHPSGNAYDGNWNTWAEGTFGSTGSIIMNYTKNGTYTGATWQIKDGAGTVNLSIPSICYDAIGTQISLKATSHQLAGSSYAEWFCWNGTAYQILRNTSTGASYHNIYEEGIYWMKVTTNTSIANGTLVNDSLSSAYLSNGDNWSCSVSLNDLWNLTAATSAQTNIINQPPVITNPIIDPNTTVSHSGQIFCNFTADDPDSALVNGSVEWYANGTILLNAYTAVFPPVPNGTAMSASFTGMDAYINSNISCFITLSDNITTVTAWDGNGNASIINNVPTTDTPFVNPVSPHWRTADLSCYVTVYDLDSDNITLNISWYKNGILDISALYYNLHDGDFNGYGNNLAPHTYNDKWSCSAQPSDNFSIGAITFSTNVTIQDAAPALGSHSMLPLVPMYDENLTCYWNNVNDIDGDPMSAVVTIYDEGVLATTHTFTNLSNGTSGTWNLTAPLIVGDTYNCSIVVSDTQRQNTYWTNSVIAQNHSYPVVTLITPAVTNITTQSVAFTWNCNNAETPTLNATLYLDGSPLISQICGNNTLCGYTYAGPQTCDAHGWAVMCTDTNGLSTTSGIQAFTMQPVFTLSPANNTLMSYMALGNIVLQSTCSLQEINITSSFSNTSYTTCSGQSCNLSFYGTNGLNYTYNYSALDYLSVPYFFGNYNIGWINGTVWNSAGVNFNWNRTYTITEFQAYIQSFFLDWYPYILGILAFAFSFLLSRSYSQMLLGAGIGLLLIFMLTFNPVFIAASILMIVLGFIAKQAVG